MVDKKDIGKKTRQGIEVETGPAETTPTMAPTMAPVFVPITERLKVNQVVGEDSAQSIVKEALTVPDQKPPIEKIINVDQTVKVTDIEVINDKVIVEGIINMQIVYVADEPDQSVHHMHQRVTFTQFIDIPGARPDMTVQVTPMVEDLTWNIDLHDRTQFTITIVLELFAKITETQQVDILVEAPPGTTVETERLKVQDVVAEDTKQTIVSDKFKVPKAKPDMEKILDVHAKVALTNKKIIKDKIIIDGVIDLQIMYVADEPSQPVHHMHQRMTFTEFVDVPGAMPGMNCNVFDFVEHVRWDIVDPRTLEVEVVLELMAKITESKQLDVITDITGPIADVVRRRLKVDSVVGENSSQTIVKDISNIPAAKPDIEKIISTELHDITITDVEVIRDKVIVTGFIDLQIMYVANLPDQPVHHVRIRIKFRHFIHVAGTMPGMDVTVSPTAEHITAKVNDEARRRLTIEVVLKLFAKVTETVQRDVVISVAMAEPTMPPTVEPTAAPTECPAGTETITYTVQPGDSIFKLARRFGVTMEEIIDANPDLTDPNLIFVGQQLIIPCAMQQPLG